MNDINEDEVLKSVSRSFYLSIRILPKPMRRPVGIAYLLARAADSITDSNLIKTKERNLYLQQLLNIINQALSCDLFCSEVSPLMTDPSEFKLLQKLPEIIESFSQLEARDQKLVKNVVTTLISGMQMDLTTFYSNDEIIALKDTEALERYTYLVAGCVGEFWTKSAILHLPEISHWDIQSQENLGIEFGKALQLTNILRDVAKDARLKRCYLPETELTKIQLTTDLLLDKNNDHLFRPIIFKQIELALQYFESAENYLTATPRNAIRLRLASIWPILIGLKTLGLIANKENFLDPQKNIKVQRKWVYSMLLRSLILVGSNRMLSRWINNLKQDVYQKL